jgi:hypothetical protein
MSTNSYNFIIFAALIPGKLHPGSNFAEIMANGNPKHRQQLISAAHLRHLPAVQASLAVVESTAIHTFLQDSGFQALIDAAEEIKLSCTSAS